MRVLSLFLIFALAACSSRRDEPEPPGGFNVADQIGDWSGNLQSRNGSNIRGTVSVHSAVAAAVVRIAITGAVANGHHPWHVHSGTCDNAGAVVGNADDYDALHVAADGTATATETVGTSLNDDLRYYADVHRSATDATVVACANLNN